MMADMIAMVKSFGYRSVGSCRYAKPAGHGLFVYQEDTRVLSFVFRGNNDKIVTNDTAVFDPAITVSSEVFAAAEMTVWKERYQGEPFNFTTLSETLEGLL